MADSNVPAGNLRPRKQVSYRDAGTKSFRTAQPSLTISEQSRAPNPSKRPSKSDVRKKGKGKAVEKLSEDESEEDEILTQAATKRNTRKDSKGTDKGKDKAKTYAGIYAKNEEARRRVEDLLSQGFSELDAYMTVETEVCKANEAEVARKTGANSPGAIAGLQDTDFENSIYPDAVTMDMLGIKEDFELLANNCGVLRCLAAYANTWISESKEFLASVTIHTYDRRVAGLQKRDGGGYILFQVDGQSYKCTLREIQEIFEFKEGEAVYPDVAKEEIDAVWNLLTGEPVFVARNAKGNWIRNPAISYFRRAVAHVMFARDTTGPINKKEMAILVMALKDVLKSINGRRIVGDRGRSGMAYVLADHLTKYRKRADSQQYRTNRKWLSIGGTIKAILLHCDVPKTRYKGNHNGYRKMNQQYLIHQQMMYKGSNELNLWYRFRHPDLHEAYIKLPNLALTSLRTRQARTNAKFLPNLDVLTDLATLQGNAHDQEVDEDDEEFEPSTMEASTSHPAKKKKTGLGKRVNKWMEKQMRRIIGFTKTRDEQIDLSAQRLADLESRLLRIGESPVFQRQNSATVFRHQAPDPTPARHSSYGFSTGMDIDPPSQPFQGAANPDDMTSSKR